MTQDPSVRPAAPFVHTPNRFITIGGTAFAYRDVGENRGIPLVLLNHWGAVLDNFDPRIVDGLAKTRRVIAIDYRGIGGSDGISPLSVNEMALDVISLIRAMRLETVDLFGFSLGGFVAQQIAIKAPVLVRKMILAGTGPAGGEGIERVGVVSWPLMIKGLLTWRDPKFYLFFTGTASGRRSAADFLNRLRERETNRGKGATLKSLLRQLVAIKGWGRQSRQDIESLKMNVLIAHGEDDVMVPVINARELATRIPNAQLIIYPDAGHGGVFQHHADFVQKARDFLGD